VALRSKKNDFLHLNPQRSVLFLWGYLRLGNKYMLKRVAVYGLTLLSILYSFYYLNHYSFSATSHKMSSQNISELTFKKLEKIRNQKAKDITSLLSNFNKMAVSVEQDSLMLSFFSKLLKNKNTSSYEYTIDERYVESYGDFYDILFVDSLGIVRHSVKKESDFHESLFSQPFSNTLLGKTLKSTPEKKFIEFEFYNPSAESAAFFIVPYKENDNILGWFVFQLASNSLNGALSNRAHLGRTGEVYLVNNKNKMLTDSRFFKTSTVLKQIVATEAVKRARKIGEGYGIIEDYRDTPVFSSFQKVEIFGLEWILIVEIDEEEVLTNYYQNNKEKLLKDMLDEAFVQQETFMKKQPFLHSLPSDKERKVDMNEYFSSADERMLVTYGVATCTALSVLLPNKEAYLAHLSPTDAIYMGEKDSFFKKRERFHLLEEMFRDIKFYDIYPSNLKNIKVYIVMSSPGRVNNTVDAILDQGLDLKNIYLLYNPEALSANVFVMSDKEEIRVEWNFESNSRFITSMEIVNMSSLLKHVIKYSG
jgi:hypothetical protein